MKLGWRVAEAKKVTEMQKIYMMLAGYPIVLVFVAILIPYIGVVVALIIYVLYLAYIIFRLHKISELDVD